MIIDHPISNWAPHLSDAICMTPLLFIQASYQHLVPGKVVCLQVNVLMVINYSLVIFTFKHIIGISRNRTICPLVVSELLNTFFMHLNSSYLLAKIFAHYSASHPRTRNMSPAHRHVVDHKNLCTPLTYLKHISTRSPQPRSVEKDVAPLCFMLPVLNTFCEVTICRE